MRRYSVIRTDTGYGVWDSSYRDHVRHGRGERKGQPLNYETRARALQECSAMNEIDREKED